MKCNGMNVIADTISSRCLNSASRAHGTLPLVTPHGVCTGPFMKLHGASIHMHWSSWSELWVFTHGMHQSWCMQALDIWNDSGMSAPKSSSGKACCNSARTSKSFGASRPLDRPVEHAAINQTVCTRHNLLVIMLCIHSVWSAWQSDGDSCFAWNTQFQIFTPVPGGGSHQLRSLPTWVASSRGWRSSVPCAY